ncbi:MAG: hypothetical protein ABH879_04635 [archaeon]
MRSQITLFISLGLVMLILSVFVIFAVAKVQAIQLQKKADLVVTDLLKKTAIEYYVTSCLEVAAKDGLALAGSQGGAIYGNQIPDTLYHSLLVGQSWPINKLYGVRMAPVKIGRVIYNVSYGINVKYNPADLSFMPDPYPYAGILTPDANTNPFRRGGIGWDLLPLCQNLGPNRMAMGIGDDAENTCKYSYGPNSIQENLQEYIAYQAKECVELESFAEMLGYKVHEGDVFVNVTFGEDDLYITANYPLNITIENHEPVTRLMRFSIGEPIRLKKIYLAAKRTIEEDANNVFFSMGDADPVSASCRVRRWGSPADLAPAPCLYDGMEIERITEVCKELTWDAGTADSADDVPFCSKTKPAGNERSPEQTTDYTADFSDIFTITDRYSLIDGQPYRFMFAVQNRHPALDWVHTGPGTPHDILAIEGQTITIDPYGYDPDEDMHGTQADSGSRIYMDGRYGYSGWKETGDAYFDYTRCTQYGGSTDCVADPAAAAVPGPPPVKWTDSAEYVGNSRTATYKVERDDVGLHYTTLTVCDDEGLCDRQDVSILVFDLPKSVPSGRNPYSLPTDIASVEDPYTLDASDSVVVFGDNINAYQWKLGAGDIYSGGDPVHTLPDAVDITTIKGDPIAHSPAADYPLDIGLSLTVQAYLPALDTTRQHTDMMHLHVFECLPHESSAAPYPYNSLAFDNGFTPYAADSADPFQADHACCLGNPDNPPDPYNSGGDWGTYAGADVTCYEYTAWGPLSVLHPGLFDTAAIRMGKTPDTKYKDKSGTVQINPGSTPGYANDIFKRTYTRSCSGERGNICSGGIVEVYQVHDACADPPAGQESCSGPPAAAFAGPSSSAVSCEKYPPGTTFEKIAGGGSGYCNSAEVCSLGPGDNKYGQSGRYKCKGQCDASGSCDYAASCQCSIGCGASAECGGLPGAACVAGGYCDDTCTFHGKNGNSVNNKKACACVATGSASIQTCTQDRVQDCWIAGQCCTGTATFNHGSNCASGVCASGVYYKESDSSKDLCECRGNHWFANKCCGDGNDDTFSSDSEACFEGTYYAILDNADGGANPQECISKNFVWRNNRCMIP